MERTQLFDLMGKHKLYGMKAAFDEIMATAIKRQHEPQRIVGDLLNAEINEKQARSIKYQLTIAKLPLDKDLDDFQFEGTPINQTLVNDLAGGGFIAQQRNAVEAARARRAPAARHRRWRTRVLEGCRRGLAENARAALLGAQDRERARQVAEEPAAQSQTRVAGDLDGRNQGRRRTGVRRLRGELRAE